MVENFRIFVVEDDRFYGNLLKYHLSLNPDNEVFLYENGTDCLENLHLNPNAICLDYSLPDIAGLEVLKRIKRINPDVPVLVVSGQEDVQTAVELLKNGAYDYVVKNDEAKDRVWHLINRIKEHQDLKDEVVQLRKEVSEKYDFSNGIKGSSNALKKVFHLMEKALNNDITVSITGETGTGKEMVAKSIHYNSQRKNKPFVVINISAIPKELLESELFGHEKGSFTGAQGRRIGVFEQAHKGTLFLDEIGEMDISIQAKLLRVLQEREFKRVGGNDTVKVDVRVVVATHRNLSEEVRNERFREDLYYRLLGIPIELPPLRERDQDVIHLAQFFADSFAKENKIKKKTLDAAVKDKLLEHPFPGNVRELKAVIELSVVMSEGPIIGSADLQLKPISNASAILSKEMSLKEYNRKIIRSYLDRYNEDVLLVAKKLDIGKSTIYRMIKNDEL